MRKLIAAMGLLFTGLMASSAQAAINIDEAIIQNGQVFIAGDQAQRRAPISWENVPLFINSTNGGAFTFTTTILPADCIGRLKIGMEERDVVIENCTPADITVIEAGVPQTGQTTTVPIVAPAGSDGALQKGVAWPNPRFTDNLNGTITDNLTGLIWLKNANCFGLRAWATAISDANGLANGNCGLTDGSVAGDWRLPNLRELQSLVDYGFFNPARSNVAGTGQAGDPDDPFTTFRSSNYWSSTTYAFDTGFAWFVYFVYGIVDLGVKADNFGYVLAVRGGL